MLAKTLHRAHAFRRYIVQSQPIENWQLVILVVRKLSSISTETLQRQFCFPGHAVVVEFSLMTNKDDDDDDDFVKYCFIDYAKNHVPLTSKQQY